ncbi:deoxyguanosinetriphosphate triphosphohydrolase family protein [Desulforhopalus sp. 52FAK]
MAEINSTSFTMSRLEQLNQTEKKVLSGRATFSTSSRRRHEESPLGYRQNFALDADRIIHSRAYSRYIDKTQVFSLIENDHITHRVLHVQLVARVARTIGRFLRLNEDLIEAIALGHDIGHPPFGHDGEMFLSKICLSHGLPAFQHNIQSVRFLDTLERKGRGWNLSLQVLDGILCHDGEVHLGQIQHCPIHTFEELETKLQNKSDNPKLSLLPATLEGCVVRMADTIAYIGRDIEDAIVLGLITRDDLPKECTEILGNTNGTIVYSLVTDLIENSDIESSSPSIGFSPMISEVLLKLKQFNYKNIYLAPETKKQTPQVEACYSALFMHYLRCLRDKTSNLPENIDLMQDIYVTPHSKYCDEERVRDFMAGMTDNFFVQQATSIGCTVPVKSRQPVQ